MTPDAISNLRQLVEKISLELVFAEPGKDNGLLPLNNLLGQIEEGFASRPPAPEVAKAVSLARAWVDQLFEANAVFDAPSLKRFTEWTQFMQLACDAGSTQKPMPPIPVAWQSAPTSGPATPTATATATPAGPGPETTAPMDEHLILNLESDADLLREFTNESHEHLVNIEQGVLVLEEKPQDADTLNATFRAFHTFKGGSGFLNLTPIKNLAHELESMLDLARQHKLTITSEIIDVILAGGDTLKQFVTEIELQIAGTKPLQPILIPTQSLRIRIRTLIATVESGGSSAPSAPTPIPAPAPSPAAASTPPAPAAAVPSAPASPTEPAPAGTHKPTSPGQHAASTAAAGSSVKVDTMKLDSLVDLVGELVIAQSLVAQDAGVSTLQSQQLTRNLAQLGRITKELQRIAMSLRMVPIRATFQKMHRLVRDTAGKMGKEVDLVMEGEETELDRTIVEEISDPLVHMIRNSLDHGIERPDIREAAGKPRKGTIRLRSFYQGGNIVIEIQDDGAGLSKDRILKKAIEKGVVGPGDNLSEKEIFNLIFAAGFSTAEVVTEISGRGVGMDVVRKNIEKLRGKIDIISTPGRGSTFTIYLPLTLAIIDGLIVGVGSERYILPTLSVCESFRPTREMVHTLHERGEMVNVRGRLAPLLRLYDYFGITPASTDPTEGIVVVVESGQDLRCVLVDQLIGKQEVVIKNLGETFKQNRALAGGAILGDGRVGLILDAEALVQLKTHPLANAA